MYGMIINTLQFQLIQKGPSLYTYRHMPGHPERLAKLPCMLCLAVAQSTPAYKSTKMFTPATIISAAISTITKSLLVNWL